MVDHRADVEDMDDMNADKLFEAMEFGNIMDDVEFENIENANNKDEVFEVLDEMEVDFENIMDQESSDEEVLSDDSGYASDMSEYEINRVEKFV